MGQQMTPPARFKTADEYLPHEQAAAQMAESHGEPVPRFESIPYRFARIDALHSGGLHDQAAEEEAELEASLGHEVRPVPLPDQSPAERFAAISSQQAPPRYQPRATPGAVIGGHI